MRPTSSTSGGRAARQLPDQLVALVLGLSVIDMSQNAVANLGWTDIKLTHPVYIGDTIYAESICLDKRESSSRPEITKPPWKAGATLSGWPSKSSLEMRARAAWSAGM